jgi:Na+-driven multidrug efflux pump
MPRDREVLRLALPALGALIAEPLYVLGDTAIVGHLGTTQLAGLALAGLLLGEVLSFCTFLEYGTTSKVARLFGADQQAEALRVGVQATWLALALGLVLVVVIELAAGPALTAMGGGETAARDQGLEWIRVAALGRPSCCSPPPPRAGCAASRTRGRL